MFIGWGAYLRVVCMKPRDGGYTDINLNFDTGAAIPQIINLRILFHIYTS